MSIFKSFSKILKSQKLSPKELQELQNNSYLMVRYFSNNQHTSIPANIINVYHKIPPSVQVKFLKSYFKLTGLNKIKYIPYVKQKKYPKEFQKIIDNIQRYYNINKEQAIEYFELMPNEEKDRIYKIYDND